MVLRPFVIHAEVVVTALPVPPVAHSMPPVVQQVPTPVVPQHVIHVVLVNTTKKPVKRLNLLLAKLVMQVITKTKLGKHRVTIVLVLW